MLNYSGVNLFVVRCSEDLLAVSPYRIPPEQLCLQVAMVRSVSNAVVIAAAQVTCYWLMRALNRRSVVVIAMALLMLISMGIIYYEAVVSTIDAVQDHRLLDFGTICVGEQLLCVTLA